MSQANSIRTLGVVLLALIAAGAAAQTDPAAQAPASAQTDLAEEYGWPRLFESGGASAVIHQPQIDSWVSYSELDFRAAVAVTPAGAGAEPFYGALRFAAKTRTDLETRSAVIYDIEIVEASFPTLSDDNASAWGRWLAGFLPQSPQSHSLDEILAYIEHGDAQAVAGPPPSAEVAVEPPVIFASQRPAILVLIDGEPALYPIEGSGLRSVVNTNWDLFVDDASGHLFLLDRDLGSDEPARGAWLTAPDLAGPWSAAGELPAGFAALPDDWQDVKEHVPGRELAAGDVPAVFTSTRPAELILIAGTPAFQPLVGTRLMWIDNTDSDLFFDAADGRYYFLVSGRWFRAAGLDGPWSFATADLPSEFKSIPPDHPRGHVLASVPGTPQAEEAVLLAQTPTQATVQRSAATAAVVYQGEPEFATIEGTSMEYATNTASDVIRVGDVYYLCLQGVWFVATAPTGPWQVTDHVAEEIYTIPASSPVHHTTYVYVYDSDPDVVTVGYTPGYMGMYVAYGCVVYGTGYYYPPYVHYGPYPVYYGYPVSYGASAWYNPTTGTYGRAASAYGPYGGAGRAAAYNPRTGTYARGAAAYGPYGGSAAYQAYNPRTGTYRAGYQSYNSYSQWGERVVQRGDDWVHAGHYTDERGTVAGYKTSEGGRGVAARTDEGDLYAGRDGNVYKRGDDGWSKYDDGDWSQVSASADAAARRAEAQKSLEQRSGSASSAGRAEAQSALSGQAGSLDRGSFDRGASQQDAVRQLQNDARARSQGTQRNRDYSSWKSQGGWSGGGRSGGGRSRGGASRGGGRRGRG